MKSDEADPLDNERTLAAGGAGTLAATLAAGEVLGSCRIIRLIGRGGMGEVYEVEHTGLEKRYALKLLPPDFAHQPGAVERFRREAKVMAHLEHPHIVQVDDFGETDGRCWLRMALAGGVDVVNSHGAQGQRTHAVSLHDFSEAMDGKVPADTLADLLRQILEGLAYAHARGAIHRDLKPGNILLAQAAGRLIAKISDFGLVKLVGEEWLHTKTAESVRLSASLSSMATLDCAGQSTRSLVGTYEYMSPEQKRGEEADVRSDLYAIGLMAYRLLTGRSLGLKMPTQLDRTLAPWWDKFVTAALEERRNDRVASCAELLQLLDATSAQTAQGFGPPKLPVSKPQKTVVPTPVAEPPPEGLGPGLTPADRFGAPARTESAGLSEAGEWLPANKKINENKGDSRVIQWVGGCVLVVLMLCIVFPSFTNQRSRSMQSSCLNNLRLIDGSMQQYALDNSNAVAKVMTQLVGTYIKETPVCKGGGTYSLPPNLTDKTSCSVHGTL